MRTTWWQLTIQHVFKLKHYNFYKWEVYTHELSQCCNPTRKKVHTYLYAIVHIIVSVK
jgi:hypothetical protein